MYKFTCVWFTYKFFTYTIFSFSLNSSILLFIESFSFRPNYRCHTFQYSILWRLIWFFLRIIVYPQIRSLIIFNLSKENKLICWLYNNFTVLVIWCALTLMIDLARIWCRFYAWLALIKVAVSLVKYLYRLLSNFDTSAALLWLRFMKKVPFVTMVPHLHQVVHLLVIVHQQRILTTCEDTQR